MTHRIRSRRSCRRSLSLLSILTTGALLATITHATSAGADGAPSSSSSDLALADSCASVYEYNSDNFPHSTRTTNRWFPLTPGTQFTYQGTVDNAAHEVVFTVTNLTKVIDGVRTRVIWDQDFDGSQIVESELTFFAVDSDANVWTVGEYPEEYDNGEFNGAPSTWIAGADGAEAGVLVPGHPRLATPGFIQGFAPDADFFDCGKVHAKGRKTCVPVDCYKRVLVVDEWSPNDPDGGHQRKDYAPHVGLVRIGAVDDPQAEVLTLTRFAHLDAVELAEAHAVVLGLERRAYEISDVYRSTPPIQS
jgi:hypothetical protein